MLNVKLSLCASCKHTGGAEVYFVPPFIVNHGTRWTWVVNLTSPPLYLQERGVGTRWIRGWVVSGAILEVLQKSIFLTLPGLEQRIVQPVAFSLSCLHYTGSNTMVGHNHKLENQIVWWCGSTVETEPDLNHPLYAWESGAKEVKEGTSDRRNFIHQHFIHVNVTERQNHGACK